MNEGGRATLVGVATGTVDGGVAIVRVSGPQARPIVEDALLIALGEPRVAALRRLALPSGPEHAVTIWMPGPASLTGEDVVELHVHAGSVVVDEVLTALGEAGARAAGPGDFSRRAFERGRARLDELEGVAATIAARSSKELALARRLAAGEVGRAVTDMCDALLDLRAEIEAHLDFPEDVPEGDRARWRGELVQTRATLDAWRRGADVASVARAAARIVIAGPPNAGKSTLFNALLGRDRALVSPQAGTTRDVLDARWRLPGRGAVEVELVDTAGMRDAEDALERAGIERTRGALSGASLIVWVTSADAPGTWTSWAERAGHAPRAPGEVGSPGHASSTEVDVLCVENKVDLATGVQGPTRGAWRVSARTGEGLGALSEAIARALDVDVEHAWVGAARHRVAVEEAGGSIDRAIRALADGREEIVAFELASAYARLSEITGQGAQGPVGEDVLERVFARFCIGK